MDLGVEGMEVMGGGEEFDFRLGYLVVSGIVVIAPMVFEMDTGWLESLGFCLFLFLFFVFGWGFWDWRPLRLESTHTGEVFLTEPREW